jgi:hypothetical protein
MSETMLSGPVELNDAELDAVAAGLNAQHGRGLVVVGAQIGDITVGDVLSDNTVDLNISGNTVNVPIGVAVAALGGAAGVLNKLA